MNVNDYRRKNDILIIGTFSGIVAKVIHGILGYIAIQIWPSYLNCIRIAAGLMFSPEQVMAGSFWIILYGMQIDLVVGVVIAIVTILILERWGYDYYIWKGAMVGLVSWVLFYNVLSRLLSRVYPTDSILHGEISFVTHLAFGISLTWSAVWIINRLKET